MANPFRLLQLVIAAFIAAACATTPKPSTGSGASTPEEQPARSEPARDAEQTRKAVEAAMARETAALPLHEVPFPEGAFKAQVEATGAPKVIPQEGFVQVEIPIGTETDISCFVYPDRLDTGGALMAFLGDVTKSVKLLQLRTAEIAPVGIDAVVILHAAYLTETKAGKQVGLLKVAARTARGNSLVCFHDEPGYTAAFSRMVQTFARTLTPKEPQEGSSRYGELQVMKIRDIPVGFERRRYLDGKNGGRVDERFTLMLMPRSATEMVAEDTSRATITDKAGRVEQIHISAASGGETSVELSVTRGKKNEYAYEGTLSGKTVKGTFKSADTKGLPGDEIIEEWMRTRLFAGQSEPYKFEQYDPKVDLAKPMELTVKAMDAAKRTVNLTYGAVAFDGQVDANGLLERGEMSMGPVSLTVERIAKTGSP